MRVGNAAYNQAQFDILGAIVDCVFEHTRSRDSLSERSWRIVVQAVETAPPALARSRPRHLGSPRRARRTSRSPRSCAGSRRTAARASPRCAARRSGLTRGGAPPRRSTPTSARTPSANRAASRRPTGPTSSTRRCCCCRMTGLPARPATSAVRNDRARDRRRAGRRTLRLSLPHREDRRRHRRRARGHVHGLLVLARLGARRDRRTRPCAREL